MKTFEFIVSQISTQLLVLAVQVLLSIITMFYIIDLPEDAPLALLIQRLTGRNRGARSPVPAAATGCPPRCPAGGRAERPGEQQPRPRVHLQQQRAIRIVAAHAVAGA